MTFVEAIMEVNKRATDTSRGFGASKFYVTLTNNSHDEYKLSYHFGEWTIYKCGVQMREMPLFVKDLNSCSWAVTYS